MTLAGMFACWMQNFAIFSTSFDKNIVGPSVKVYASFVVTNIPQFPLLVSRIGTGAGAALAIRDNDSPAYLVEQESGDAVVVIMPGPMLRILRIPFESIVSFGTIRFSLVFFNVR